MSQNSPIGTEQPRERYPEGLPLSPLSGADALRVRDLTGEIVLTPRRECCPIIVSPARRGGKLTLSWYDYGVLTLIAASLIAGIVCLLHGV